MRFVHFLFAFLAGSVTAAPPSPEPTIDPGQVELAEIKPHKVTFRPDCFPQQLTAISSILNAKTNHPNNAKGLADLVESANHYIDEYTKPHVPDQILSMTGQRNLIEFTLSVAPKIRDLMKQAWGNLDQYVFQPHYTKMMQEIFNLLNLTSALIFKTLRYIPPNFSHCLSLSIINQDLILLLNWWLSLCLPFENQLKMHHPNLHQPRIAPSKNPVPNAAPVQSKGMNDIENICRGDQSLSTPFDQNPNTKDLIAQLCVPYQPDDSSYSSGAGSNHFSSSDLDLNLEPPSNPK